MYVMSDLHGCYDKYLKMLEKIGFSESDKLYILGDVIDRGPDGIKILLDLTERVNVIFLRGNHEDTALIVLSHLFSEKSKLTDKQLTDIVKLWCMDGGETTLKQFLVCSEKERERAMAALKYSQIYDEVEVAGKKYFLSHTVPGKEAMNNFDKCKIEDFLWGEPEYDKEYFPDKVFITGHTPTSFIDSACKGKIYKANNHIAVDCGAVFGCPLGCIRLDDMQEFYI